MWYVQRHTCSSIKYSEIMWVAASYKDLGILICNELILTEEERDHWYPWCGESQKWHKATQSEDRHKNIGVDDSVRIPEDQAAR